MSGRGVAERIVQCGDWKEKYMQGQSWIGLLIKTKSGNDIMKVNDGVVVKTHKLLWEHSAEC